MENVTTITPQFPQHLSVHLLASALFCPIQDKVFTFSEVGGTNECAKAIPRPALKEDDLGSQGTVVQQRKGQQEGAVPALVTRTPVCGPPDAPSLSHWEQPTSWLEDANQGPIMVPEGRTSPTAARSLETFALISPRRKRRMQKGREELEARGAISEETQMTSSLTASPKSLKSAGLWATCL